VFDGVVQGPTVDLNQQVNADDLNDAGTKWEYIVGTFAVTGRSLTVQLTNDANSFVQAEVSKKRWLFSTATNSKRVRGHRNHRLRGVVKHDRHVSNAGRESHGLLCLEECTADRLRRTGRRTFAFDKSHLKETPSTLRSSKNPQTAGVSVQSQQGLEHHENAAPEGNPAAVLRSQDDRQSTPFGLFAEPAA
jgi:hypothetical protein